MLRKYQLSIRTMFIRKIILVWFCLSATCAWTRVLLRWTLPSVPPAATTGIGDLVVSWEASDLIRKAHDQGYRVYAEIQIHNAANMPRNKIRNELAGLILNPGDSQQSQIDNALRELRSAYKELPLLVLDTKAKQPQMKGQLVIKKDGVLQVSSPTAQPWIDSNLALMRFDQALRPAQTPLYEFKRQSGASEQPQDPDIQDYLLAIAEAGAFHADLILDLSQKFQSDLLQHNQAAWDALNQLKRYLDFFRRIAAKNLKAEANIGVIADTHQNSYEPVNLLARHNIQFAILEPSDLSPQTFQKFGILVFFAMPDERNAKTIADFASKGGTVVLADSHGSYPWHSAPSAPTSDHAVSYSVGKGRIIELSEPVIDPETFAQDVRRLMEKDKVLISLWNALTTIAVPYRVSDGPEKIVELVNYAEDPLQVQVQIKGFFSSIRYETPERDCCESLTSVQRDGFTEFVIPSLRIAGRVYLAGKSNTVSPAGR